MSISNRPWMAECEIKIMASLFEAQQPERVLEWGAGGSTLYWPPRYDFIKRWVAVEHDKPFARELRSHVASKVAVRGTAGERYWKQRGQYDMIIVDGRHRVECLEEALGLLAEGGIVVLHDSGRSAYNKAWTLWPHAETLYAGEFPIKGGYYKHRGITVFFVDSPVSQSGWCREYITGAPLPRRPAYMPPEAVEQEVEASVYPSDADDFAAEIEVRSQYIDGVVLAEEHEAKATGVPPAEEVETDGLCASAEESL